MDGEAPNADAPGGAQPDPALMDGAGAPGEGAPAGGLVLGDDGLPIQVEENKEDEIIPPEVLQDMNNLWHVFDMQKTSSVEISHLRTIMRALDFDLNEEELAVVRKQIDPDNTGVIKY